MSAEPSDVEARSREALVCALCGLKVAPGPGGRLKHCGSRRGCGRLPRPVEADRFDPDAWSTEEQIRAALRIGPPETRLVTRMDLADWRSAGDRQPEPGQPSRKRGRRVDASDEVVQRVALLLSRSWSRAERGHGKRPAGAARQGVGGGARR